jgi:RNA polymerase sigma-70 factor (ECF subfamily)
MQAFLADIEHRAFRMAQIATGNRDDALDIVQDAMMKLVQKYSDYDQASWKPLFYSILESRIMDWHRRQSVRNRFRSWLSQSEDDYEDPIEQQSGDLKDFPDMQLQDAEFRQALEAALTLLPIRQQQVFLLRLWENMDIRETAQAMQCSESSVKTHYARALEKLREALKDHH